MLSDHLDRRPKQCRIVWTGTKTSTGRPMVRPRARRGDDDLGAVTDRTGRVEGRAVTASSRGVRGCHSTSDIPSTSAPIDHLPTTSYHLYDPVPYDPYGYSQPPQTSYDPYAHTLSLPIRMPGLDPTQHFSRTQILLNDVSGPGLQLGTQFFEQLAGSVQVDSSYSGIEYEATARGNPSSDVGDDHEPVPVVEASSSCHRFALGKGKGLTGNFMSVMSKIAGSR
ncbi:hypothetical protein M9H77_04264 [Catharanthus roseus]|uniref:Uncharacterized protein n=1 Tax=Catharanthus roseus TaxID=4058 RepID=A0ACC0CE30_CATRO|nr:hypothetical protein M9H77_04264 [Catharanthus roseus]